MKWHGIYREGCLQVGELGTDKTKYSTDSDLTVDTHPESLLIQHFRFDRSES